MAIGDTSIIKDANGVSITVKDIASDCLIEQIDGTFHRENYRLEASQIANLYEYVDRAALQNIITGVKISYDSYLIRDIVTGECRMRLYTPGTLVANQAVIGTLPTRFRPLNVSDDGWQYANFEIGVIINSNWVFSDLKIHTDGNIVSSHPINDPNSTMFADIQWLATKG